MRKAKSAARDPLLGSITLIAIGVLVAACSSSADSGPSGPGPGPGGGGGNGGGQNGGGGGATPTGGAGPMPSTTAPDPSGGGAPPGGGGMCGQAAYDTSPYAPCPSCGSGRCVPTAELPPDLIGLLADCDPASKCVPEDVLARGENTLMATCRSVGGAEGRCVSVCIPAASEAGVLPQSTCEADELCAPCFFPGDGSPTGVCGLGCDPGPAEPPVIFAECCGGAGRCVPSADIPEAQRALLGPETCAPDEGCTPTSIVMDPAAGFTPCQTDIVVAPGQPGVCIPACIVDTDPRGSLIGPGTCPTPGDKCVPCNDPLTGMSVGVCI